MVEGGEGSARLVDPLPDPCSIADTCSTTHDLLFHSSDRSTATILVLVDTKLQSLSYNTRASTESVSKSSLMYTCCRICT